MDSTGFEPVAFTLQTEGSAFAPGGDLRSLFFTGFIFNDMISLMVTTIQIQLFFPGIPGTSLKKRNGLDGIRTRGLHVANVTIYP